LQVNETILRSIVSQPADSNYVYATGYDSLDVVKNILVGRTCNLTLFDETTSTTTTTTTMITTTTTAPATTTTVEHGGSLLPLTQQTTLYPNPPPLANGRQTDSRTIASESQSARKVRQASNKSIQMIKHKGDLQNNL